MGSRARCTSTSLKYASIHRKELYRLAVYQYYIYVAGLLLSSAQNASLELFPLVLLHVAYGRQLLHSVRYEILQI